MMKKFFILALALMMIVAMTVAAQAQPTLDFVIGPSADGLVNFAGPNAVDTTLSGKAIRVIELDTSGFTNPIYNGQFKIDDGLLAFNTGTFNTFDKNTKTYFFNTANANLTLYGQIPSLGITDKSAPLVASADFLSAPNAPLVEVKENPINPGTSLGGVLSMFFNDVKCPLAESFGFAKDHQFLGWLNLSFASDNINFNTADAFSAKGTLSGDLYNFPGSQPPGAPIPGSLVLLGTGILSMLGIGLRRKNS